MDRQELIKKFIDFFKSQKHAEIKNHSLIPENDPTVLFITAGMHPLVPFLLGEKHPQGSRLVGLQRCIRTGDIEDVGDSYHHTFFEMLGNWSLGDYFKEESIKMSFEFLTKVLGIPIEKLGITIFEGDRNIPKDKDSEKFWDALGISKKRIAFLSSEDNWWGPAGKTGPCGPDTEIFYWKKKGVAPEYFNPKEKNWIEIWNNVFMQYIKGDNGEYREAKSKNIDTGMGVERTIAVLNGLEDNYLADMWKPIIEKIEKVVAHNYEENKKEMRIIADHAKAAVFIIADGVVPSNIEQGYVLRRLIRRAIRNIYKLGIRGDACISKIAMPVFEIYKDYSHLQKNKEKIMEELQKEEERFLKTLENGLKEFNKMSQKNKITGKDAFLLFQSYGFPIEMTIEIAKEKDISVDFDNFCKEMKTHQDLSRTSCAGKFKSGLADDSEATKKLHTATHMLNEVLRIVLNKPNLHQRGSNITSERLRFDFSFDKKLTDKELKEVEDLMNLKIQANLPIVCNIMPLDKAKQSGAHGIFDDKYDKEVKVYSIGRIGEEFSKEICAGPHVKNTSELGKFKIIKEESVGEGVRRIKAILE